MSRFGTIVRFLRRPLTSPLASSICLYGFSTFLVVIVKALGYSTINSQLLTAPVYVLVLRDLADYTDLAYKIDLLPYTCWNSYAWAAIVYLVCAAISDRKDIRFWLILPTGLVTCVGYVLLVAVQNSVGVSLFACL